MSIANTRDGYGWAAIALHWISAAAVIALYLTGETVEEAASRAEKTAAMANHVSIGALLFAFLAARLLWSAGQPHPRPLERSRPLRLASMAVHGLLLAMIAVQIVSGPLVVWSMARPVAIFDWYAIPSPFPTRLPWLHEGAETIHKLAPNALWPLLALHVIGALKHTFLDRDATLRRMLWVRTAR